MNSHITICHSNPANPLPRCQSSANLSLIPPSGILAKVTSIHRQSIINPSVTNSYLTWELDFYGDRPKCLDFTSHRSRPTHQMTTTQIYQNCIVTDWQCIGTHWQTSRQSIANSVTNPCMSWELEYYRDRPKCLNGGPFRLSVFTPAPILFCHSANIHRSANPMSIWG